MSEQNIYLLSMLPALDQLGEPTPLKPAEFLDYISEDDSVHEMVEAILLSDDLLQRESALAGDTTTPQPVVLDPMQLTDEMPLPDYLVLEEEPLHPLSSSDRIWMAYFLHMEHLAETYHSSFLMQMVASEIGLRNALAEERAAVLGLEARGYIMLENLSRDPEDFIPVVNEWAQAQNPLEALKVLDTARWNWLTEKDDYYSFDNEELLSYAAKLMLASRWERLTEEQERLANKSAT